MGLKGYADLLYPSAVIDNFVFNFGDIFDALRDTVLYFSTSSRGEYNVPYDAGYGVG